MSSRAAGSTPSDLPSTSHPTLIRRMLRHNPSPLAVHGPPVPPAPPGLLPRSYSSTPPVPAEPHLPSTSVATPRSPHTAPPASATDPDHLAEKRCTTHSTRSASPPSTTHPIRCGAW